MNNADLEKLVINCIRTLSMDAVQKANSGHPGTPMALAPVAFKIWDKFIAHNPRNPDWPNRDRFVLSAGHASMLLYSILHIYGYEVSLEEIKNFRQLHSKCAGHPEFGFLPGIETTSGPLGQGASTSVGMAIAEKWLANHFNKPAYEIIKYNIYSILSDGDIMEGVTSEAASLAGHLELGNIVWIYDNNKITIEGETDLAFSEDVEKRFQAYNWHTQHVDDANDLEKIEKAFSKAKDELKRPSLVIIDSHIAYGSPNSQDTCEAHGSPLGEEEVKLTKKFYGWDPDKTFHVPDEVKQYGKDVVSKSEKLEQIWNRLFDEYSGKYPDLAQDFELIQKGQLPENWDQDLPTFPHDKKGIPTRKANNKIMNAIGSKVKWLLGG
ncbi:MAG: transketolase, partial [Thermodesulfobacteriota bacterium]